MHQSRRNFVAGVLGSGLLALQASSARAANADIEQCVFLPADFAGEDDSSAAPAINRAIAAAAAAHGGTVQLEAIVYDIDRPIMLASHVRLRGRGIGKTILRQTGTRESWAALPPGSALIQTSVTSQYDDLHVASLTLQGLYRVAVRDGAASYAQNGMSLANARNSSVQDCLVEDTGTGIVFHGSVPGTARHNNLIARCTARNARSWVGPGVPGTPRGITMATDYSTVRDCTAENCHTGYYVATEHGTYENCSVRGWADDGYYVNANYVTFIACKATDGAGSGFAVNPSTGHLFRECVSTRCSNAGLRFRHAGDIAPSGNRVLFCTFTECGYGFLDDMTGASSFPESIARRNQFIGNVAQACRQSGFMFVRECDGVIRGNRAIGNNRSGVQLETRGGIALSEYCLDNIVEDNVCDDLQRHRTQLFGLYSYPASITGASVENRNWTRHKSRFGIDVIGKILPPKHG